MQKVDITTYPDGYNAALEMVDWLPSESRKAWLDSFVDIMVDLG